MSQFSQSSEPILTCLPHSIVSAVISKVSPTQPINVLKRELTKAFPGLSWHVKQARAEWHSAVAAVITPENETVAPNAQNWLAEQIKILGSDRLISRIKEEDLRLARDEGDGYVYALGVDPNDPLNFFQICVRSQTCAYCLLRDLRATELASPPSGFPFVWDRAENCDLVYRCYVDGTINSLQWLERCNISEAQIREINYAKMSELIVTREFSDSSSGMRVPFLEAYPDMVGWNKRPGHEARWFEDWKASSAGSNPMGRHWYLETTQYEDDEGHHIGFIPQAMIWPKRVVRAAGLSPLQLMAKLARFDRTIKCPFGWYFFMVHGNRITEREGKVIAAAVRSGELHLEPRDEAVLMAWDEDPYGF